MTFVSNGNIKRVVFDASVGAHTLSLVAFKSYFKLYQDCATLIL